MKGTATALGFALVLGPAASAADPPKPPAAARSEGKLTDAQASELARSALILTDGTLQKVALKRLEAHRFKSSKAPEREYVLFAIGVLQDRLGEPRAAAQALRKLEHYFPRSTYLPESQLLIAQDDVDRRRFKEAETRLRKALTSDLPAESLRKAQELLLWSLVEQDRPGEGLDIVEGLHPAGTAKPSERGLVAMLMVLSHHRKRDEAEGVRNSYRTLYPQGTYTARVELAWGRLLGLQGESKPAAEVFAGLIRSHSGSPEANEARLALATLLSDGKLQAEEAAAFPTPDQLLAELGRTDRMSDQGRRTLLLKLQLSLQRGQWREALASVAQYRQTYPKGPEQAAVTEARDTAMRNLVQHHLEKKEVLPLLDLLDAEAILCLTADQRTALVARFARTGLPEASAPVLRNAPPKEQAALRRALLEEASPLASPDTTLALLPERGENAVEALRKAQIHALRREWEPLGKLLPRAKAGPERSELVKTYLRRPKDPKEPAGARLREAESWLARTPGRGPEREALVILVANLRMQAGDWRGALALYPENPRPEDRAWVMLMRAKALHRLGRIPEARATLDKVKDETPFKAEREALARTVGTP